MKNSVDVVVVGTGVRSILYFEIFHKNEVFDDLDCFNLTIFAEKLTNVLFSGLIHTTHIEFSDQDALMDAFRRLSLFC